MTPEEYNKAFAAHMAQCAERALIYGQCDCTPCTIQRMKAADEEAERQARLALCCAPARLHAKIVKVGRGLAVDLGEESEMLATFCPFCGKRFEIQP